MFYHFDVGEEARGDWIRNGARQELQRVILVWLWLLSNIRAQKRALIMRAA